MSSPTTFSPTTPWPFPGTAQAWCPPDLSPPVMAVPLLPSDRQLTRDAYLTRLGLRIEWLIGLAGGPATAFPLIEQKADGKADVRGLEPRQPHLARQIVHAWEDLLRQHQGLNLVKFPIDVSSQPAAIEAMREVDLAGWLDLVLPPNEA